MPKKFSFDSFLVHKKRMTAEKRKEVCSQMTKAKKLAGLLLAALLVLTMVPTAYAVTQGDIENLKDDKKELKEEKKEIEDQIYQLRNDKEKAVERRALLDRQIELTVEEIRNTEAQISGYEALLVQTAYELEENQREEDEQYALFCERARVMEESGTTSYWSVLFKAESFSDLLSRLSDVQEVMNYDQGVLDNLRQLKAQIEEKQAYQEQLKGEAEEAKVELEEQKSSLDVQRKAANDLVAELQEDLEMTEQLLKEKEAEEAEIQKQIQKKEAELAAQMAAQQVTWTASSGGYIWPESASKRITSPMGSRNTGIPGASTNHKGVDIGGVGYNTTVVAAKAGTVIISEYSNSYGHYVVINHGPGNTTLYAHMSSRSVKEGDVVSQGQAIGITGSTGISRGAHLHYEIKEGGVRINPLDHLPGYIKAW